MIILDKEVKFINCSLCNNNEFDQTLDKNNYPYDNYNFTCKKCFLFRKSSDNCYLFCFENIKYFLYNGITFIYINKDNSNMNFDSIVYNVDKFGKVTELLDNIEKIQLDALILFYSKKEIDDYISNYKAFK